MIYIGSLYAKGLQQATFDVRLLEFAQVTVLWPVIMFTLGIYNIMFTNNIVIPYNCYVCTQHKRDRWLMFVYTHGYVNTTLNPLTAKSFNLNFHPLEVVSR